MLPEGSLKNKKDVEDFVSRELGKPMPLDRPQWKVWSIPYFSGKKSLVIWKSHHSFGDGIALMGLNMQQDNIYDISK